MATAGNTHRVDPYKNFRFRVRFDGRVVAGMSKVSRLPRTGDLATADSRPGAPHHASEPVTLSHGVTHDDAFRRWMEESRVPAVDRRPHELLLDQHDGAGRLVASFALHRAWVSEYQALSDLDANANAVAIESLTLENEGWRRDDPVTDPPAAVGPGRASGLH